MPLATRKEKFLDGQEIMEFWVEMGSIPKIYQHFRISGIVNPKTGQPYTINALWRAAMLFMVNKPDEARKYYLADGAIYSDEEWELLVLRKAMQCYKNARNSFIKWVLHNDWVRKYESLYQDEYGIKPEDYDYFTQTMRRTPSGAGRVANKTLGRPRKDRGTVQE
jgi:hypothetical protein